MDRVRNEDVDCLEGMPSDFTGRKQAEREYEIRDIDRPEFGHPSTDSGDGGSAMVSSWWTPVLGGLPPPRQGSGFWSSESKVTGDVLGTRQASSVGSVRIASMHARLPPMCVTMRSMSVAMYQERQSGHHAYGD